MKKDVIVYFILIVLLSGSVFPLNVFFRAASAQGSTGLSVMPPSASNSVIDALHPSTNLTCVVNGGTPPYNYQWFKMNNTDLSYSAIPGANLSNYNFTPSDAATTPVWTFNVQVTDSAQVPGTVNSDPVQVTNGQKVPAPEVSTGISEKGYGMAVGYPSSRDPGRDLSSALNFSFSFNVRKYFDKYNGLVAEYEGLAFSYVYGSYLCFQFRLMSVTNCNYPHIYINCSGSIIPIYLYNCSSFDMVTSKITYVRLTPTFTNVITFHDIALQTYDNGASNITLMFTQHFIADWTKFKIETDTYADLTNMTLYYSNGSAVPFNTKFSLNFDYNVNLFNQSANFGPEHGAAEIPPTIVTQKGLYFNVEGKGGMNYSLADMTLDDNYTERQGATQIPNKKAIPYFSSISPFSLQKEQICSQRFTDLTYNVTTAVMSDPTISVMHNQVPFIIPTMITCQLSRNSISKGDSVTISGTINASVSAPITIQISTDGTTWSNLATVTATNGAYSYSWTPTTAGTYNVRATWSGDATYAGATRSSVTLTVTESSQLPITIIVLAVVVIIVVVAGSVFILKRPRVKHPI